MKVYIAERGLYEDTVVVGVYDSPERAMGAHPGTYTKTTWTQHPDWPDRSVVTHWVDWCNDKDWDSAVRITEMDFTDTGPLAGPAQSRVQTYRESDGGWNYLPEPVSPALP